MKETQQQEQESANASCPDQNSMVIWDAQKGHMAEQLCASLTRNPPPRGWRPASPCVNEERSVWRDFQSRLNNQGIAGSVEIVAIDQWITAVVRYHGQDGDTFDVYHPNLDDLLLH